MRRLGNYTSHVLNLGVQSPILSLTAGILGLGVGLVLFAAAPVWLRLPMVGLGGVALAYRHTWP